MEPMTKTDPKTPGSGACPGPERMCVICRQRFPKQNLTRYVRDPGGEFVVCLRPGILPDKIFQIPHCETAQGGK